MPSTMRLLRRVAIAAFLVWAVLWGLATFVSPVDREMVIAVPVDVGTK